MEEKGKAVETCNSDDDYSSSDIPCNKHPISSSAVGICAHCLRDRLIKLVCSDCGEQSLSSCSCSQLLFSSCTNPCSVEVGSVGRISFLIENERTHHTRHLNLYSKPKNGERSSGELVLLKRSNSSCVDIKNSKKSSGFWRIRRFFRKKIEKGCERISVGESQEKSTDVWSRSRSLCSFRGCGINEPDENSDFASSSAKISDVSGGVMLDSEKHGSGGILEFENVSNLKGVKMDGLLEPDSASNVKNGSVVLVKESEFNGMEDSGFIDLKLDSASESKPEFSAPKMSDFSDSDFSSLIGGMAMNDGRMRKGRKRHKAWRWIFKHHSGWEMATMKVKD
ncbi:uncharacterized protein LOC132296066 [Cornus florida]|uniref:uncharacterized protein LOC132296066 n=1 Tax=Cornus florida TaxID=4283 RepID=UPI0028A115F1|nr:uncharacterized protein LOC132296066 [Cornus florida]